MFGIMDTNNDGKVTEKEFRKACKKNPDAHELASILAVRLKGRKHRKVKRKWKKEVRKIRRNKEGDEVAAIFKKKKNTKNVLIFFLHT